jgi:L-ascorbate metabolism protein UlaG (beta-lactamase superfamily)
VLSEQTLRQNSLMNINTSPRCRLTYLGGPSLLIEIGSLRLLSDPTFDRAGTTYDLDPIHLTKLIDSPTTPAALGRIDGVLLSHDQHPDNLDDLGREMLPMLGKVFTTLYSAERIDGNVVGLDSWQSSEIEGADGFRVEILATPAQHGPDGTQEATGPVTGFILTWPGQVNGPLYLSGDTVLFDGTAEIARRFQVGTAILHIGRVKLPPMGDLHFSLDANAAAQLAKDLGARTVIPVHYEGWAHFTQPRAEAEQAFMDSGITSMVQWLPLGIAVDIAI